MRLLVLLNKKFLSLLGSYAALIGIISAVIPKNVDIDDWFMGLDAYGKLFIMVFVILGLISIAIEIQEELKVKKKTYKNNSKNINKYMKSLIENGGNCAIFSRNISWGNEIKEVLRKKSTENNISIFMPKKNDLAQELEKDGAEIYSYGELEVTPISRFTVVHWEKDGSSVSIARPDGGKHVIQIYDRSSDPSFAVVLDLLNILKAYKTKLDKS